jgi:DNA-binding protein HU-beta
MTLNHKDFLAAIAAESDLPVSRVEAVYAALVTVVRNEVAAGNEVKLHNLATFKITPTAERQGRNPSTNQPLTIPAKNALKVAPAKNLKDATPPYEPK